MRAWPRPCDGPPGPHGALSIALIGCLRRHVQSSARVSLSSVGNARRASPRSSSVVASVANDRATVCGVRLTPLTTIEIGRSRSHSWSFRRTYSTPSVAAVRLPSSPATSAVTTGSDRESRANRSHTNASSARCRWPAPVRRGVAAGPPHARGVPGRRGAARVAHADPDRARARWTGGVRSLGVDHRRRVGAQPRHRSGARPHPQREAARCFGITRLGAVVKSTMAAVIEQLLADGRLGRDGEVLRLG